MGLTDWIQGILRSRRKHARRQASRQQRAALSPGLFVRELEERRVLSVDTLPWDEPLRQLVLEPAPATDAATDESSQSAGEGYEQGFTADEQFMEPLDLTDTPQLQVQWTVEHGALWIDFSGGDPAGNAFSITLSEGTVQVFAGGEAIGDYSLDDGIQSLSITGVVGGNDALTLDFGSSPDLLSLSSIHVDLGGDDSDDLIVVAGGQPLSIDYAGCVKR
jgi:hypothetical protein